MATIPTVKSLLFNTRLVYLVKYQEVLRHLDSPDADLKKLDQSFHTLFAHWGNPKFWTEDIPWIAGKTADFILQVNEVNPDSCDDFKVAASALLKHFKEDLLKDALERTAVTDTSMWNLRMLNALRITLQQEEGRVTFFKGQGQDLSKDAKFQEMNKHQQDLVATYRNLLTNNSVEATESKVENVKKRGVRMEAETVLEAFLNKFQKLSAYLNKQVTEVALIPHFAVVPSEENQKSINALAIALIKMDQRIGTLVRAGKDFTKEADFETLSSDQLSLQNAFRKALYGNTITASSTDTAAIDQITNSLTGVDDLSGMKTKYLALNELMRTHITTING